jgi:hypothetical protein
MDLFFILAFSIVFVELFMLLAIIPDAQAVLKLSGKSVNVMKSKSMSDSQKEAFMRKNSVTMFATTLKFIAKFILIFAILFGLFQLVEIWSAPTAQAIAKHFISVTPMVVLTMVTMIYVWIRNVIRRKL